MTQSYNAVSGVVATVCTIAIETSVFQRVWWMYRGRAERMAFADSFTQAYHFRLLYMARALMYPIMGAMRHTYGQNWEVWVACSPLTALEAITSALDGKRL